MTAAALTLGCMLCLGTGDDEARLDLARDRLHRGLLSEAEHVLAELSPDADPAQQGWAELILGNVAYERADFEEARRRWSGARRLFARSGDDQGGAVADGNLQLADEHLARARELEAARARIAGALAAAVAVSIAACMVLARRA